MCRSVPQIVVVSILTMMSVGFWICGSGASVHDFSPGPWYTSAFMMSSLLTRITGAVVRLLDRNDRTVAGHDHVREVAARRVRPAVLCAKSRQARENDC